MISGPEIVVIAIVALLLFGPDKIPEILKTLKKAAGMYAEARDQIQDVVSTHVISPDELEMLKDPLGLGGAKGTTPAQLLTPERKSLYSQTAKPTQSSFVEPSISADVAAPVATGQNASAASASLPDKEAPEKEVIANAPTTAAASIWASLEQDVNQDQGQTPPEQKVG